MEPKELFLVFFQVYDKDTIGSDDFMGEVYIQINKYLPNTNYLINLEVQDGGDAFLLKKCRKGRSIGTLEIRFNYTYQLNQNLSASFVPIEHFKGDIQEPAKKIEVMILEGKGLRAVDRVNHLSDPYCKLSIGKVKMKTKVIYGTVDPHWKEQVSMTWQNESRKMALQIMSGEKVQTKKSQYVFLSF